MQVLMTGRKVVFRDVLIRITSICRRADKTHSRTSDHKMCQRTKQDRRLRPRCRFPIIIAGVDNALGMDVVGRKDSTESIGASSSRR